MTTGAPLIRLRQLTKVFYAEDVETHALAAVDLEIHEGEYVAVAGPSGCGKSTLLSILGLLDTPTSGQYWLRGEPVEALSFKARARVRNRAIGFIFQSFNLIGDLTVAENVELPLTYRGLTPAERRPLVTAALERVHMAHRAKHLPGQLSGGQQQRVAVARAVVGSPSILLCDEPTGNLDSKNGAMVMDLLQGLHAEGATICMVTHDPRYADRARRTIHLFDGRVVDEAEAGLCPSVSAPRRFILDRPGATGRLIPDYTFRTPLHTRARIRCPVPNQCRDAHHRADRTGQPIGHPANPLADHKIALAEATPAACP